MKDILDRILKAFNVSGRDWAVLLLALLLAFSIWLIHNLSLKYNDYLTVSVVAQCKIDGHAAVSSNTCEVVARGRATGYRLLKLSTIARHKAVSVDFSPAVMKHKEGDLYYVTSDCLQEYAHLIYGSGVAVEYFVSDTLYYRFPAISSRKVPVHPVFSLSYSPQYMSDGQTAIYPDSVYVYGEPSRLESISEVYTKPVRHSDLHSNVTGVVELEKIRGVRLSEKQVSYRIDVVRYVEMTSDSYVNVVNVPSDKIMTVYPSVVTVKRKTVYPLPADFSADPEVYVDYGDYINSVSGKCRVRYRGPEPGLIDVVLEPEYVECMLEERW